ncbi:MAG: hypothetical protein RL021_1292 [Bacteroidota bacterium]
MKLFIAGESNVHVQNYCRAISTQVSHITVVTETPLAVPEAHDSHVISFRGANPFRWINGYSRVFRLLKNHRPDLVHLHQVNRLAYFVCRAATRLRIPVVTTAWGSDVLLVPQRNAIYRHLVVDVLRRSRKVTADAQVMITAMQQLESSDDKYIHLQYGIDPIEPVSKQKIVYSNRLHRPLYNIDIILRDFAAFHATHPDWRLVVGGSGPDTVTLHQLAGELGISAFTDFTGWLDKEQNEKYYSCASIYVSIPSSDGTSVSLLEAMSAGCVPVVSDLPVTSEWIRDGVNGVIRKPGINPLEEAAAMDRERCATLNREVIGKQVDRNQTTRRFIEIYQEVVANS